MEKESYITKKHKKKDGTEVAIKYRVDADFVPTKADEISEEFIQAYCKANGKVEWLTKKYSENVKFMTIRKCFAEEFFNIKAADKKSNRQKWMEEQGK